MPALGPIVIDRRIPNPTRFRGGGDSCFNCNQDIDYHTDGLKCPRPGQPPKWCQCYSLTRCWHGYCANCGSRTTQGKHTLDDSPGGAGCGLPEGLLRTDARDTCPMAGCRIPYSVHCLETALRHRAQAEASRDADG